MRWPSASLILALLLSASLSAAPRLPHATPQEVGLSAEKLGEIDALVSEGLSQKRMPGCVVLVARRGKIALLKAYGDRAVQPQREPMTADTVFDLASITKPAATATSVMLLIEQGKLRLEDTAAQHWPEFGRHGKERITVRHLLTHQGGLIPDNSLAAVHVYFPDPWWKSRHKKRRVMSPRFVLDIERTLEPGGVLHFWTDVEEYFHSTLEILEEQTRLVGPQQVPELPAEHDMDYRTNFERRVRQLGKPVFRSQFTKHVAAIKRKVFCQ